MPTADLHIEMPQQLLATNGRLPPMRKTSQTSVERIMRRSERKLSKGPITSMTHDSPRFGFMFDIDGVFFKGKYVIEEAKEAVRLLTDENGEWRVPCVWVTNAANPPPIEKAALMSQGLGVKIRPDQVLMAHSPLNMFRQFHHKFSLVIGQGPVRDVARALGFNNITTIDTLQRTWPKLDVVDHARRALDPSGDEHNFQAIEVIVLLGEPVNWETSLQILVDLLLTNGQPYTNIGETAHQVPYPHLPILACNADLQFMTDAPRPRFGHGAFLACLEALYLKITGFPLRYEALIGKPAETTYAHAEDVLIQQAREISDAPIRKLYFVGDNPDTDIFGANLYDRFLRRRGSMSGSRSNMASSKDGGNKHNGHLQQLNNDAEDPKLMLETEMRSKILEQMFPGITESPVLECRAILVETGVGACAAKNAPHAPPVIKYPSVSPLAAGAACSPTSASSPLSPGSPAVQRTKTYSFGNGSNNGSSKLAVSPRHSQMFADSGDEADGTRTPPTTPSHQHRDFFVHRWEELAKPCHSTPNILEAVKLVFKEEHFE